MGHPDPVQRSVHSEIHQALKPRLLSEETKSRAAPRPASDTGSTAQQIRAEPAPSGAQIVVETLFAALALGTVVLFGLRFTPVLSPETQNLARLLDYYVCILFASKAIWDLWHAADKRRWWRLGWIDFAASIPEIEVLRALRLLRLLLIIRVLRSTTKSIHGIATHFNANRTAAVISTVFSLIVVSIVMGSFLILGMESGHPEANILTAESALLWAVATLFGAEPSYFGDYYPVTSGGRLIALWLVIVSLGLIGSLAGIISAWIEEEEEEEPRKERRGA